MAVAPIRAQKVKRLRQRTAAVIITPTSGHEDKASHDLMVETSLTEIIQRSKNQEVFDVDCLEIDD